MTLNTVETSRLSRDQLAQVVALQNSCVACTDDDEFHGAILRFASFLGFEFVLCASMVAAYDRSLRVYLYNLSNPTPWMDEYARRRFVEVDPVRVELECRLAKGSHTDCFVWDAYDRTLGPQEREVIDRRTSYGLRYGCSAYCNSVRQEALFLISLASARRRVQPDTLTIGRLVVPHLTRARKRLDLRTAVARLTNRERVVADWLLKGKSNREIAGILDISEHTVKFHLARLFDQLSVSNRQSAVAVLLAERLL